MKEMETYVKNMCNYLEITREIVLPFDKVAYQAINNIISMSMISFGRKHGLDYFEAMDNQANEEEEKDIDDIMNEINKETTK